MPAWWARPNRDPFPFRSLASARDHVRGLPGDGLPPHRSALVGQDGSPNVNAGRHGRISFPRSPRVCCVADRQVAGHTDAVSLSAFGGRRSLQSAMFDMSNLPGRGTSLELTDVEQQVLAYVAGGWRRTRSPTASTCPRMSCTGWSRGCSTSSSQRQAGTRCATSVHATAGALPRAPSSKSSSNVTGHRCLRTARADPACRISPGRTRRSLPRFWIFGTGLGAFARTASSGVRR